MIAKLRGLLDGFGADFAVIDVNGVGYLVSASTRTLAALGAIGEEVVLHTEMLVAAARRGVAVGEYAARLVKKAVVGTGGADKAQIHFMVQRLLPGAKIAGADAADALAVAITHAHHLATARRVA